MATITETVTISMAAATTELGTVIPMIEPVHRHLVSFKKRELNCATATEYF